MYMPMGNVPPPRGVPWDDNMSMMPLRRSDNTMGLRMRDNTNMDCQTHEMVIEDVELAHAYVPFQKWCPTFMPLTGLKKGTIFPALVGVYGWERRQGMGADNI